MTMTLLAFAIPFFRLIMGLEYALAYWMRKDYFRFNDSVANLGVGIAERLLDLFTAFLALWYKANKGRGVEIIGLAFERKNDSKFAKTALTRLINRYDVQYDILVSGIADKKVASSALPALNKVLAFPTTLILDRQGKVAQNHTGYTGPATGNYYDEYMAEFNLTIDKLLRNEPNGAKPTTGGGK